MRVVQVVAGAGAMYCGACARDAFLAFGLRSLGHDVTVVPIYTPLRVEGDLAVPQSPLVFGGIGAYLRETTSWYGKLPAWAKGVLDRPGLITFASRFAVQTQAADLGRMTVSVLEGEKGVHAADIEHAAKVVGEHDPDVVILPNSLLTGFVSTLRRHTKARILCQVQGEDGFLNELPDPWKATALDLVRSHAKEVDGFIAPCRTHALDMQALLGASEVGVVPPAVSLPTVGISFPPSMLFIVGHLSSIRHAKGLDVLLRAMLKLDNSIHLRVAGKVLEPGYFHELREFVKVEGLSSRVEFLGEVSPVEKHRFFASCHIVCLPSRLKESRGIAGLEALAHMRPIVANDGGIYREMAELTNAIRLFPTEDSAALSEAIFAMRAASLEALGEAARELVRSHFSPAASSRCAEAALECAAHGRA